jgi:hypothetical protein
MRVSRSKKINLPIFVFLIVLCITGYVKADFLFGEPQNMGPIINSASNEAGITLSSDGLELYFSSERSGGRGNYDIWVSTRQSVNDPWDSPANIGSTVNSSYSESYPSLSSDGLTLYFSDAYSGSPRSGGIGGGDIWMTTRPSRSASWGTPMNVGAPINSSNLDMSPTISGDGLTLVFTSNNRAGGMGSWDIWMSTRVSVQDPWGPPVNLGITVNSAAWDGECGLSWDGRTVLYDSGRTGIFGAVDMFMCIRKILADPWANAINLGPVINSSSNDGTPRFSADMRTIYFCSDRPGGFGGYDLFEAPVIPIVDLNGDGIVDSADMCTMVDHWGGDYPLCDIGPAPWGDGIVDIHDLIVLSEYLFEEVNDPTLVAHWPLDEAVGTFSYDNTGVNDAFVIGGAAWQPNAGQVDGALELNGVDGCAIAGFVLNPANGPFSVFAWINGGAPGQVVLSQLNGANWMAADPDLGCLMTELMPPAVGRFTPQPLKSESVITDGQWHRIGFVWDGVNRALYVDDILVAEDTQANLQGSDSGLYIGTGKAMESGTYWSGLIDDVRIYNRAVRP